MCIVVRNTAQNSSDHLHYYLPDIHHSSDVVYPGAVESASESPGVPFEGDSDSGYVQLLDYTVNLVLRGFSRCTVLARRAISSMSCHHATLFACTLLCT